MTQTFDLNKMGLASINNSEMQIINGGFLWGPVIVAYVLLEAALNPSAHVKAFKEGWNSVK